MLKKDLAVRIALCVSLLASFMVIAFLLSRGSGDPADQGVRGVRDLSTMEVDLYTELAQKMWPAVREKGEVQAGELPPLAIRKILPVLPPDYRWIYSCDGVHIRFGIEFPIPTALGWHSFETTTRDDRGWRWVKP